MAASPARPAHAPSAEWSKLAPLPLTDGGSLSAAVYESLSNALRRGSITTGSRLVEGDVAHALAVSRTPVREALQRLAADGLIRPAENRGYVVADLMADAEVVFLIRERLEGLAAGLAARRITLGELEALRGLQAEMQAIVDSAAPDIERLVELNGELHRRITQASNSPRLIALVDRLHPEYVSTQVIRSYDQEERRRSIDEHQAILDALWNRDPLEADRLVQLHLEHGKAVVLREMGLADSRQRP